MMLFSDMFKKFKNRSHETEMMDDPGIPREMLYRNLDELDTLNRTLGGHRASLKAIKQLIKSKNKKYHIVDLGCGSGDSLIFIAKWARNKKIPVSLTGVDNNKNAIDYLKQHCKHYPEIKGIHADYNDYVNQQNNIDILHCSLFCHHLSNEELVNLFRIFQAKANIGFIINDIQRSFAAYYSTILFTTIANASPLARNDGPVSVLSGFKKREMKYFLKMAGIHKYKITKRFAFRIIVVGQTN